MAARISKLSENVVHKIAAGEIIVRPSNALKELIENSIDAKATRVDVLVKEGGLKILQITDNGHGINVEDLPILCQRFTTSKLSDVSDLETIATLGFRGEALASISHVSHLTVKTKTEEAKVATQADFADGEIVEKSMKKLAGVTGTQITVTDLFYNSRHRLEVFDKRKTRTEEYHRILDTVQKYAILYNTVQFTVKRFEDTQPVIIQGSTAKDRIRTIYEISPQDLLPLDLKPDETTKNYGLVSVNGFATGLNFRKKSADSLVLFINNRLVTNYRLNSAIRNVYMSLMPSGSVYYFVYLDLQIDPPNVDVNVHPTKREVKILYQLEINEMIAEEIRQVISKTDETRDFRVQSYISSTILPPSTGSESSQSRLSLFEHGVQSSPRSSISSRGAQNPRYEYNLVRTDPKQQTLTPLVRSTTNPSAVQNRSRVSQTSRNIDAHSFDNETSDNETSENETSENETSDNETSENDTRENDTITADCQTEVSISRSASAQSSLSAPIDEESLSAPQTLAPKTVNSARKQPSLSSDSHLTSHRLSAVETPPGSPKTVRHDSPIKSLKSIKELTPYNLLSIESLLGEIKAEASPELLTMISEHTFVGIVDAKRGLAAIQWDVRLYLIDYKELCRQMFYQSVLTQFGNFGTIHLGNGLMVSQLLAIDRKQRGAEQPGDEDAKITEMLSMTAMLEEYFRIILRSSDQGCMLVQLPLILPEYPPPAARIPRFLTEMLNINWNHEKECINGIAMALAGLHVPFDTVTHRDMLHIFDRAKFGYVPTKSLKASITEIANLPGLYRVFERC